MLRSYMACATFKKVCVVKWKKMDLKSLHPHCLFFRKKRRAAFMKKGGRYQKAQYHRCYELKNDYVSTSYQGRAFRNNFWRI